MASSTDCSPTGLTNDEILSLAIEGAEIFWNRVATSNILLSRGELKSVSGSFETDTICSSGANSNCIPNSALKVDKEILIACNSNTTNFSNNAYVMAVAVPTNIEDNKIVGSLILINSSGTTATNVFGKADREQQVSILAHEIGHALGLGHSGVKDSLMYYESIENRSSLGWDDIQGITYLYPREQTLACSSVAVHPRNSEQSKNMMNLFSLIFAIFLSLKIFKGKRFFIR